MRPKKGSLGSNKKLIEGNRLTIKSGFFLIEKTEGPMHERFSETFRNLRLRNLRPIPLFLYSTHT
jgi:hypothetical protein